MTNRSKSLLASCLALMSGCAGLTFTEDDRGLVKEVYRGTEFSISLPSAGSAGRPDPQIQGSIIRFQGRRRDDAANRELFDFKAEGLGESDIHIPGLPGDKEGGTRDFVIHVKIKSSSDGYTMPVRQ